MVWFQVWATAVRWGFDDAREIITQFKSFIPRLQNADYADLLKAVYHGIGFVLEELGDSESAFYFTKVVETALEIGDEIQIKTAEAYRLFNQIKFGLQDGTAVAQLEELLAYFAPQYAKSETYYRILLNLTMVKRAEKAYEQAIDYGQRSLAIGQHWQEVWIIGQSLSELAQTYALMGQLDAAKQQHLSALEWHLAVGQMWQTLGQLYSQVINIPEWLGGQATAVACLSMITHHTEVVAYHQQLIGEALPQIKAKMGEAAFAAAWERGKEMGFETAVSQVRLALASVGE